MLQGLVEILLDQEEQGDKEEKTYQNIQASLIIFPMEFKIFPVAENHHDDKHKEENSGKDQLSGTEHVVFFANLSFCNERGMVSQEDQQVYPQVPYDGFFNLGDLNVKGITTPLGILTTGIGI